MDTEHTGRCRRKKNTILVVNGYCAWQSQLKTFISSVIIILLVIEERQKRKKCLANSERIMCLLTVCRRCTLGRCRTPLPSLGRVSVESQVHWGKDKKCWNDVSGTTSGNTMTLTKWLTVTDKCTCCCGGDGGGGGSGGDTVKFSQ